MADTRGDMKMEIKEAISTLKALKEDIYLREDSEFYIKNTHEAIDLAIDIMERLINTWNLI